MVSCDAFMSPSLSEHRVFDAIEECRNIYNLNYTNPKITEYDNPSGDKYIKNFEYVEFFGAKYTAEEIEFELYAYRFVSNEIAAEYFHNPSGDFEIYDETAAGSWGALGRGYIVVRSYDKAYIIYSNIVHKNEIYQVMREIFSLQLSDDKHIS